MEPVYNTTEGGVVPVAASAVSTANRATPTPARWVYLAFVGQSGSGGTLFSPGRRQQPDSMLAPLAH